MKSLACYFFGHLRPLFAFDRRYRCRRCGRMVVERND